MTKPTGSVRQPPAWSGAPTRRWWPCSWQTQCVQQKATSQEGDRRGEGKWSFVLGGQSSWGPPRISRIGRRERDRGGGEKNWHKSEFGGHGFLGLSSMTMVRPWRRGAASGTPQLRRSAVSRCGGRRGTARRACLRFVGVAQREREARRRRLLDNEACGAATRLAAHPDQNAPTAPRTWAWHRRCPLPPPAPETAS